MGIAVWVSVVGLAVNIVVLITFIFKMGKWAGNVESSLQDIRREFGEFKSQYGDLPERVSKLEGWREGTESRKC